MRSKTPVVIVLGPSRTTVSGVSTHLNLLFDSHLSRNFHLLHFQVGSEGRNESAPLRLLRLLLSPFALALKILLEDAAVVHINTSLNRRAYFRDLVYLLVAKLCGVRVIYQIHGGALPQQFAARSPWLANLLRASFGLPDVIVVLAQAELAAYRAFVPNQMIVVFPNGIDLAPYGKLARPPAEPLAHLRLLYIGRLVREKGVFDAILGFCQSQIQGVAASLTIAGSGPDEAALQTLVKELCLENEVHFTGPVFDQHKIALYAQADVLLLPTYATEGLPYALLEAMAAGLPAITTRVGGIPDVVTEGIHGLFVPPCDEQAIAQAITRLATDRALLADLSGACQRRIAHSYSIDHLAGNFERLYREMCPGRRAADLVRKL